MYKQALGLWVLVSVGSMVSAQAQDYQGVYVGQKGFATVEISKSEFELTSISQSSGNLCHLNAQIQGKQVQAESCRFKFIPRAGGGFEIQTPESCSAYCGYNADMSARYKPVPQACQQDPFSVSLAQYRQRYSAKDYAQAAAIFAPLLKKCQPYVDYFTYDQAASELSLAYYHLKQKPACLATLQKTQAYGQSSESLKERMNLTFFLSYEAIAQRIEFNQNLCQSL